MKIYSAAEENVASPDLYIFDPAIFDAETDTTAAMINSNHRYHVALEGRDFCDADMAATNQYLAERSALRVWAETYSGKVPSIWGGEWYQVMYGIETGQTGLTPDMVEAAVHYPHRLVVLAVAVTHSLNPDQRTYVDGFDWENFERQRIDTAQQSLAAEEIPGL